jgi:dTMP kinase
MSFVVIEGLDGSGKSTQLKLIRKFLQDNDILYQYLHFPRTESPYYGDLVARFLRGEFGDIDCVHPRLVSVLYAGDRKDAASTIRQWLDQGRLVIVDRYVYSNIAFQCAKIESKQEQLELRDWIIDFEYNYNKIPKPDVNIFLDVPFYFTENNLKNERNGNERDYLKGAEDIHENDLEFQKKVRKVYLEEVKSQDNLEIIECADGNEMLHPDVIKEKILNIFYEKQILK